MKRTLITSALPYANGYLHLGHCAGAYLPADLYARRLRLLGNEILWVCGSDEHGVAITIAAEKEKVIPEEIIDKYHFANLDAFEKFGMSFDIYSRTSNPLHQQTAKEFFKDFLDKGYLVEKEEEQFYDEKAKMFLPDRYVEGICPNCGYDKARGDQCDNCGAYYEQLQLKEPISLISGKTPIVKKTTHWFMQFNKLQEFLEKYIESHSSDWKDNVLQQTRSWLSKGFTERPITRDLSWGIKIDDIDGIPSEKTIGKVIYVWFEAVLGYITATKVWAIIKKRNSTGNINDWELWWKSPDTRYIAFIGKDNIVFHTLIFPAMLHARGEGYILPDNVPANEFLNLEGQKFSKSRNWSIDLKDFLKDFPEPNYIDALRYTLAMNLPETRDSDFTWKDFQSRNNNELSAIFGNFVNRTMQFIHKSFNGEVPCLPDKYKNLPVIWKDIFDKMANNSIKLEELDSNKDLEKNDSDLLKSLWQNFTDLNNYYEKFRFRDAVSATMNIARASNKYFNDEAPWKTLKNEPEKCAKSLYVCMQLIRTLAVLFAPVLPETSKAINNFLKIDSETGEPNEQRIKMDFWSNAVYPFLPEGHSTNSPKLLFVKIEDYIINQQTEKLGNHQEKKVIENETVNELISIDEFKKIKIRTAIILEAENVPKSKKLIKLKVDIGSEQRQIIAGIAEHYKPEELIGKTISVIVNLQPAKLMGLESNGMLLAANAPDGKLSLMVTEKADFIPGAEVR